MFMAQIIKKINLPLDSPRNNSTYSYIYPYGIYFTRKLAARPLGALAIFAKKKKEERDYN